jgi:hypothetical protein
MPSVSLDYRDFVPGELHTGNMHMFMQISQYDNVPFCRDCLRKRGSTALPPLAKGECLKSLPEGASESRMEPSMSGGGRAC